MTKELKEFDYALMKELSEAFGASGYESVKGGIREIIEREVEGMCDEKTIDDLGNLICKLGRGKTKVMFAAHMDEIGMAVKYIDDKGYIYFVTLGGFYSPTLINQTVRIKTKNGEVKGVIGSKPPHIMKRDEEKEVPKIENLFIDVGAKDRKEVEAMGVEIGSPIVWEGHFEYLNEKEGIIKGKCLDNRIGCYVNIDLMKRISNNKSLLDKYTFYFVFTVQEEVGLKGARVSAMRLMPDIAIVIDTSVSGNVPFIENKEVDIQMGKGPSIEVIQASGAGLISSPEIIEKVKEVGNKNTIPYQLVVTVGGVTDAAIIYISGKGIKSISIGVPTKNLHSPVEVASVKDIINASRLIEKFLEHY